MTTNHRILGFAALACASHLLLACAATPAPKADATPFTQASTPNSMNQTTSTQKHIVGQLIEALKTERMLQPDFFQEASLQEWFGPIERTSSPSPTNQKVIRERLVFVNKDVRLVVARQMTGTWLSFSANSARSRGLTELTVDDLIATLGEPQKKMDFVAEQIKLAPRHLPSTPEHIISPPLLRTRGESTHQLGNHDLSWSWETSASKVTFEAKINGDGSVDTLNGEQEAL